MQHDFQYVSEREAKEVKKVLLNIINEVQDIVREDFTFQYHLIGSASRNMITYDKKSNIGYDFDIDFCINVRRDEYEPGEIRKIIRDALNQVACKYGYGWCQDSTRVLTIKRVNPWSSKIEYSCDIAIVRDCKKGKKQYIRYNKNQQNYTWEFQPAGYQELPRKIEWLEKKDLWDELRDYYIYKKNKNTNPDKKSRAIFTETVNEMCQKNGYKSKKN